MKQKKEKTAWFNIAALFLPLYFFRLVEYIFIRMDYSRLGEAVFHLILSLLVMLVVLRKKNYRLSQIGFTKTHWLRDLLGGAAYALGIFFLTYNMEFFILQRMGREPQLRMYLSKYIVDPGGEDYLLALNVFALAAGALLSVFVEEGMFRGFIIHLAERKSHFYFAVFVSSFLYAIWANVEPLRYLLAGREGLFVDAALGAMLFAAYFLQGIKYALEFELTGSLWFPMADHFVHYTLVKVLHVETAYGTDELFLMRVITAQAFSLICVLVIFLAVRHMTKFYEGKEGGGDSLQEEAEELARLMKNQDGSSGHPEK